MITLLLLLSCVGGSKADDSTPSGDSPVDTTPPCSTLNSGDDWYWTGECPQMRTPCDIVVTGCTFTIDYAADGGMTMGMPYAGTIDGDTITFADDNQLSGCVGTVEDPDTVSGSCEDGCTFSLQR